jgi:FHA domain
VAKLIIYRGDTLDREIDLGEGNARVGRGDQNDIVLPDPAKSVSRFHAELRFENGAYSIVDLNSQNGTWVAGRRVPQATLEPGVPVVVGTYRLILKPEAPPPVPEAAEATLIAAPPAPEPSSAATMVAAPRPATAPPPPVPPAPRAEASKAEPPKPVPPPAPPVKVESPKPPAPPPPAKVEPPKPPAPPPPAKVEPPKPAAPPPAAKVEPPKPPAPPPPAKVEPPKPSAPPVAAKAAPAPKPAGKGMPKGLLFGGFAMLVVAVMVAAVFLTPLKDQLAGLAGSRPAATATPAGAPPSTEAAKPPDAPPPVPQPVPEPPPTATTRPPAPTPAAAPARSAREPGEAVPGGRPRERTAPAGGRRGAAPEAKPKPLNLAQTLETARSAMIKGDYLAAIAGFEAILKVDPKYPSAADLLGVARGGAKNASQLAIDSGSKAEMSGDYAGAQTQYERAQQLDPDSSAAPDAMRRLKARMQAEGEDAFKRAKQYDALGRVQDAISMYGKAIQLLPPDHANAKTARERLAVLKGGL